MWGNNEFETKKKHYNVGCDRWARTTLVCTRSGARAGWCRRACGARWRGSSAGSHACSRRDACGPSLLPSCACCSAGNAAPSGPGNICCSIPNLNSDTPEIGILTLSLFRCHEFQTASYLVFLFLLKLCVLYIVTYTYIRTYLKRYSRLFEVSTLLND